MNLLNRFGRQEMSVWVANKTFRVATSHRLTKHTGKCQFLHGHNYTVIVGLGSRYLNDNDMVMDFSDIKVLVNKHLDKWDHCHIVNANDETKPTTGRIFEMGCDPTAEAMAKFLFDEITKDLVDLPVFVNKIIIYETDDSFIEYFS